MPEPLAFRIVRRLPSAAAIALVLLGALALSPRTSAREGDDADQARRLELSHRIAEMLDAVQSHAIAPDVSSKELVHGAIRGMLDTLDPHTHFLDAEAYKSMREGQDGSFYGLGIIISVRRDAAGRNRLTVISPIDGMPAKRLGIRPGDIIAAIDGTVTDELTLDGAVAKLRGDRGTSVTITIERAKEKFDLSVERAEIPTESVTHAYMIRPDVGFIRVKDFTKTTTTELHQAIASLRDQGMRKLILDLRDNPGGLLDESVSVASTFLDAGQLVVETRGRVPGSNEKKIASVAGDRLPAGTPMIVLVNRGSASASEIVSGALQDHDRALIVGNTTWGKGLVQSVYSLSGDCGLALTTARYYTPSGRQIQRDYRSSYYDYYYGPRKGLPHGEGRVTDGGRPVYSGGGIQPDVDVDEMEIHPSVARLIGASAFFRFANEIHARDHAGQVRPGYALTDADLQSFRKFLDDQKLAPAPAEWTASLDQIKVQLLQEIVNVQLGLREGFKVINEADPQVQAALQLWPRAERAAILKEPGASASIVAHPAATEVQAVR